MCMVRNNTEIVCSRPVGVNRAIVLIAHVGSFSAPGSEPISLKSHVVADWTHSCVNKGSMYGMTDGYEMRQVSDLTTLVVDCRSVCGRDFRC